MDEPTKKTFQALEEITDLRYQIELNFLEQLNRQVQRSGNTALEPFVQGGLDMLNSALEGRYSLERNIISRIKSEIKRATENKNSNNNNLSDQPAQEQAQPNHQPLINAGTILIKSKTPQKKVTIPLNINNSFAKPQEVTITVDDLKNMKDGASMPDKINVDKGKATLPAKGTAKVMVTLDLSKGFKSGAKYFTTLSVKGSELRVFQIILERFTSKNKEEKSSVSFLPIQ